MWADRGQYLSTPGQKLLGTTEEMRICFEHITDVQIYRVNPSKSNLLTLWVIRRFELAYSPSHNPGGGALPYPSHGPPTLPTSATRHRNKKVMALV